MFCPIVFAFSQSICRGGYAFVFTTSPDAGMASGWVSADVKWHLYAVDGLILFVVNRNGKHDYSRIMGRSPSPGLSLEVVWDGWETRLANHLLDLSCDDTGFDQLPENVWSNVPTSKAGEDCVVEDNDVPF